MSESAELEPWQQRALESVVKGKGRGTLQVTGRGTGKSQIVAYQRLWKDIMEANTKVSAIELGEGTVYGSRYYTAKPIGGSWSEMEGWCRKTFGEGSRAIWGEKKAPEPALRWYANNNKFWFRSEKDRDLFIIMWRA